MTLVGGAMLWPLAARAQQQVLPVIGFLSSAPKVAPDHEPSPRGFRDGLNEAGYFIGRNVTIEHFLAHGHYERLPALADEMVRRQVSLIVAAAASRLPRPPRLRPQPSPFCSLQASIRSRRDW